MVLIVDNGVDYIEPEPDIYIEPEPTPDIEPEIITVDGKDYDISGITNIQRITITFLAKQYPRLSQEARNATPFDVYVYNLSKVHILRSLFEPTIIDADEGVSQVWIEPVLDIEPESIEFQSKLFWSDLKVKFKKLKDSIPYLVPLTIGVGVVGVSLVGYQYSKSYVSEKGKAKARGK